MARIPPKTVPLLLVILALGVMLIVNGFTGMVVMEETKQACTYDRECPSGNVCCPFYQESSGVCDSANACDVIWEQTKRDKEAGTAHVRQAGTNPAASGAQVISGVIVLMLCVGAVLYYSKKQKLRN